MAATDRAAFAADVAAYLSRTPRQLPSKYFYDALGSALFDAICRLPWYRITRAETALLARHGAGILQPFDRPVLAELGGGNGDKLATLVAASARDLGGVSLIDISPAALAAARQRLAPVGIEPLTTFAGSYEEGLRWLHSTRTPAPIVVLFLGSNIGNFDPPADLELLRVIRAALREGDALVLGADLVKPERELLLAYDDPLQVTAAFNLNLLRRINDELEGDFDLRAFAHRAVWNAAAARVEMHLVSRRRQTVRIGAAALEITFRPDEAIWTESSSKYTPAGIVDAGRRAGFTAAEQWVDEDAGFALTRLSV